MSFSKKKRQKTHSIYRIKEKIFSSKIRSAIGTGIGLCWLLPSSVLGQITPPMIDLDGDNSSGATDNDFTNFYTPAAGTTANPAQTEAADIDVVITDDGTNIIEATIILTNRPDGNNVESLIIDATAGGTVSGVTASAYNQATGTITLTGSATIANYQAIISTLRYQNNNISPNTADRIVTVQVTDSDLLTSNIASTTIRINSETFLVPNPDFNASCQGANIALVLDSSGSVDATEAQITRDSVRTLLDELGSLGDSVTNVGIVEFGQTAKRQFNFTPVTTGPSGSIETTFQNYLDNVYPERTAIGASTNWEAALRETNNTLPGADILIFLTDGDPNTHIDNSTGNLLGTGESDPLNLANALPWANLIKSRGTHIYAFGIDGVQPNKFNDLTDGPNTVQFTPNPNNAAIADFDFIVNFPDFPSRLRDLIGGICNIASHPELLLVKRITAIKGTDITGFVNDGVADSPDDNVNWPTPLTDFLRGVIDGGQVQPGDEVEYTIYFLSTGGIPARNVKICDVIPANTNFVPDAFGTNSGISLFNTTTSPLPNPPNPTDLFTNTVNDGDRGDFYPVFSQTPNVCKANPQDPNPTPLTAANNTNGAVVVNVVRDLDGTNLPNATAAATPSNSYGFVRFKVRVQ